MEGSHCTVVYEVAQVDPAELDVDRLLAERILVAHGPFCIEKRLELFGALRHVNEHLLLMHG